MSKAPGRCKRSARFASISGAFHVAPARNPPHNLRVGRLHQRSHRAIQGRFDDDHFVHAARGKIRVSCSFVLCGRRCAGTASGVYNTSRQIGGALAVAVFGALLAQPATFIQGMRTSLLIAAGVALATAMASQLLRNVRHDATA